MSTFLSHPPPSHEDRKTRLNLFAIIVCLFIALCAIFAAANVYSDNQVTWTHDLKSILKLAVLLGAVTPLFTWWFRLQLLQGLVVAVLILYLAAGSGSALIGVVTFWVASFGIGAGLVSLLIKPSEIIKRNSAFTALSFVLGYAVVACILGLLSLTTLNYSATYVVLFGSLSVLGFWVAKGDKNFKSLIHRDPVRAPLNFPTLIAKGLFCTTLFVLCIAALLPETKSDAVSAYRAIILEIIDTGGFIYDPETSSIRLQSLLGLWPQSFAAILTSDDTTAKALNFSTLLAAAILLYSWTERHFGDFAAALAGACLLATPILFLTSISAFLDNSLIFLITGLLISTHALSSSPQLMNKSVEPPVVPAWRAGIALGLISAVLVMSKMTALFLVPAIGLYILVTLRKTYNLPNLAVLVMFITGTVTLIFGPFLLFVYSKTGNPVFPYYNEFFQSPYFENKNFVSEHGGYFDIRLFWDIMVNTSKYASIDGRSASSNRDGQLGIISVLMLFSLLSIIAGMFTRKTYSVKTKLYETKKLSDVSISSGGLALFCATLGIFAISIMQNNSRYIMPVLPFIGIALAAAFQKVSIGKFGHWSVAIAATAMTFSSLSLLPQFGYNPTQFGGIWQPNHREIIYEVSSIQSASDRMNQLYGNTGRVVFDHRDGGFEGQSLIAGWYDYNTIYAYSRGLANGEEGLEGFLRDFDVDALAMTNRTVEKTTAAGNFWIIQTLERLARSSEVIGNTLIFDFPPDISFDRSVQIKFAQPIKSGLLAQETGARTAELVINYACTGSGTQVLLGNKPGLLKVTTRTAAYICDGQERQISLRINELDPNKAVSARGFFKDFEFTKLEGNLYLRD